MTSYDFVSIQKRENRKDKSGGVYKQRTLECMHDPWAINLLMYSRAPQSCIICARSPNYAWDAGRTVIVGGLMWYKYAIGASGTLHIAPHVQGET